MKTPGRDIDEDEEVDTVPIEIEEGSLGAQILKAIGGKENVQEIDNCISRLRLVLNDTAIVDEKLLKATGSMGIVRINDKNIQIVYGGKVEEVTQALKRAIGIYK